MITSAGSRRPKPPRCNRMSAIEVVNLRREFGAGSGLRARIGA